jgi:hypothetical protein
MDRTSDVIADRKDKLVNTLEGGGIVVGVLAGISASPVITPVGGALLGGGIALAGWGLGKLAGNAYDTDLDNLSDMNDWVTAQFADGATSVDLNIIETVVIVYMNSLPVPFTVQTMQVCSDLGVCSPVYTSSLIPTNQDLIKEGMDNGTDECDPETEDCEEE